MPPTRPLVDTDLKKAGGGLVGVDAGGCEQADDAVRFDQPHGALDEEGVEVDVADRPAADNGPGAYQLPKRSARSLAASNSDADQRVARNFAQLLNAFGGRSAACGRIGKFR